MPRRKELKNTAQCLCDFFVSRNNDVGGYWGIGKLCLHAALQRVTAVRLDLTHREVAPPNDEFLPLLTDCLLRLQRYVAARGFSPGRVHHAWIELDFDPTPPDKHVWAVTRGNLFKTTVAVVDDLGRVHLATAWGYCAPHSPYQEHRSTRAVQ